MSSEKGILLAVEGIDGAGKTTQVNMLAKALSQAGEDVLVSKEPTNGRWGQKIRKSASEGRLSVEEEIRLLTEDRKEHVADLIKPSLAEGKTVILDRYFYSTIAYQGVRNVDVEKLDRDMRAIAPVPDMVFLLDVAPEIALARISESRGDTPNHFERTDTLTAVRSKFNELCEVDDRLWKLDGDYSPLEIHYTVLQLLVDNALKTKRCAKSYGCTDFRYCGPRLNNKCNWFNLSKSLHTSSREPTALISAPAGV